MWRPSAEGAGRWRRGSGRTSQSSGDRGGSLSRNRGGGVAGCPGSGLTPAGERGHGHRGHGAQRTGLQQPATLSWCRSSLPTSRWSTCWGRGSRPKTSTTTAWGRALDWLYAHDVTTLFAGLALRARRAFGVTTRPAACRHDLVLGARPVCRKADCRVGLGSLAPEPSTMPPGGRPRGADGSR